MTPGSRRRGSGLLEVMVGLTVLAFTVLTAGALFPMCNLLRDRSNTASRAAALAQHKLEQVRALPFAELTYDGLEAEGIIDPEAGTAGTFAAVDDLASEIRHGSGSIVLTSINADLVRVDVNLSWKTTRGKPQTLTASTLITSKEIWVAP